MKATPGGDKNQAARQPPIHEAQVFDVALPLIGGCPCADCNSLPRIQRAGEEFVAEIDVSGKARPRVVPDFLIRFHAQKSPLIYLTTQVTRDPMPVTRLLERGRFGVTQRLLRNRAAGVKVAAGGWIDGARHVPLQHDARPLDLGVGDRHGRQQRLGVRVQRVGVEVMTRRDLYDAAQVHYGDAIADVLDH